MWEAIRIAFWDEEANHLFRSFPLVFSPVQVEPCLHCIIIETQKEKKKRSLARSLRSPTVNATNSSSAGRNISYALQFPVARMHARVHVAIPFSHLSASGPFPSPHLTSPPQRPRLLYESWGCSKSVYLCRKIVHSCLTQLNVYLSVLLSLTSFWDSRSPPLRWGTLFFFTTDFDRSWSYPLLEVQVPNGLLFTFSHSSLQLHSVHPAERYDRRLFFRNLTLLA